MTHIILCCSSGMSTSLLAKRTQEAADEISSGMTVSAMDIAIVGRYIDEADLVLLGPHLKYKLDDLRKQKGKHTQIDVISKEIYQSFNGMELLKQIQEYRFSEISARTDTTENQENSEDEKLWTSQLPFKSFFTPEMLEAMRWKR